MDFILTALTAALDLITTLFGGLGAFGGVLSSAADASSTK